MTALRLAGDRATALAVVAHARDAADARLLLEALGLVEPVRQVRSQTVPPHEIHTRGRYVAGCPKCQAANRRYVDAWRMRGGGRRRLLLRRPKLVFLDKPCGRGRRRCWPGQVALLVPESATTTVRFRRAVTSGGNLPSVTEPHPGQLALVLEDTA